MIVAVHVSAVLFGGSVDNQIMNDRLRNLAGFPISYVFSLWFKGGVEHMCNPVHFGDLSKFKLHGRIC